MKTWIARWWAALVVFAVVFVATFAWAQTIVKADQGKPGNQGPWPVTTTGTSGVAVYDIACNVSSPNKVTSVTNVSTTTPAAAQAGRYWTTVCNSPQNAAGSIVKCRADGTAPVFALGNPGDVLELGDCAMYTVSSARNILCISNAAGGVSVSTYECY